VKIERVKEIYTEITQYEIRLAADPRSLGPLYLQNTIAECRNFLNAVSRIQIEVHREKQDVSRALRAQEASHEVSFVEILANDERVRRLPSIEDRKATANVILRDSLNAITALKAELQDLEYVEKAVRHRHKELTSTMSEIKLQRSLIRDEIDSGAMYGDERQFGHERQSNGSGKGPLGLDGDDVNEDEIAAMLETEQTAQELQAQDPPELPSEAIQEASPESTPEPTPEPVQEIPSQPEAEATQEADDDAKVRDFLDTPSGHPSTEDFNDVFDNL
jgi:hypothetical protein